MSNTIDKLFASVIEDTTDILSVGALNDYFGIKNMTNNENLHLIYSIYSDMIKRKGVSKDLFQNCFFTNRLDELIHTKSKYKKSVYYIQFCAKKITIGKTYIGESGIPELQIADDNHCPCCEEPGYITHNKNLTFMSPDCIKCGIYMCKTCVTVEEGDGVCPKCK